MMTAHGLGVTRACGLIGMSRSLYRYEAKRPDDEALRTHLTALAGQKRRYGYRRLHVLLCREGWAINWKRTYRVYCEAGLTVRRRKRKRIAAIPRQPKVVATAPNISWSMDFVSDGFVDGRRLRCLNIVDDFTKECLAIEVDTSLPGKRVVGVLERLAESRGLPQSVTVDNGPEFISKVLDEWAYRRQLQLRFIEPGKPQQNAYIESWRIPLALAGGPVSRRRIATWAKALLARNERYLSSNETDIEISIGYGPANSLGSHRDWRPIRAGRLSG
jgi:putative transposase